MKPIPFVVVEEPQCALGVWLRSIGRGILPSRTPLTLVRCSPVSGLADIVLSDDDLKSISDVPRDDGIDRIERVVGVESYLVPAIQRHLFNRIVWIKSPESRDRSSITWCLGRQCTQGVNELDIYSEKTIIPSSTVEVTEFELLESTLGVGDLGDAQIVFDVNLAFFSAQSRAQPIHDRCEITENAAHEFAHNPYHALRLMCGSRVGVINEGGRFFLKYSGSHVPGRQPRRRTEAQIKESIRATVDLISRFQGVASLVVLSRGHLSGRVPADQCRFIEEEFLVESSQVLSPVMLEGEFLR